MVGEIISKSSEQESGLKENTAWDSLVELAQSEIWEEHLQKANDLIKEAGGLTSFEEKQLFDYSDVARHNKKEFFQDIAQQEILEREFNSELSHVEDLELLANAGDPSVERTNVKYKNQDVPVYILKNYPFKFLGHIINYREGDYISEIGVNTSDGLVNNPKKWFEPYQEPKDSELHAGGWVTDKKNAKSNTLSTSYVDGTLQGYDEGLAQAYTDHGKSIIYGFDHIRPTTLIYAAKRDGQIPNYVKQGDGYHNRGIKHLASDIGELGPDGHVGYNEVAMFRYDDSGKPLEPSFIVTDSPSVLSESEDFYKNRIKQHAFEHGIPIILIDRTSYGDEHSEGTDEYIANNCASILAAGASPDFVKSKLSTEAVWNNYDTLKTYMPDLNVNAEFNNLINFRYSQEVAKYGDTPSLDDQKQAYSDVIYNAMVSDAYDFISRGGDKTRLLEMANETGNSEIIKYAQNLYIL